MNPFTMTLLFLAVVITGVIVGNIVVKRIKRRKLEAARQAAKQPRIDWAHKVMAAETDEMTVSIAKPDFVWKGPCRFPSIVGEAEDKVSEAVNRRWRKRKQQEVRDDFDAAMALDQLSERIEAYKMIDFGYFDDGAELDEMKAKVIEDVGVYAANLLTSARKGYRQKFVELVAFTTTPYMTIPHDYNKLSGSAYEIPLDWDELVVRYYKTPTLGDFRHGYGVSTRGSLRLLAARALKEESLVLAQVVLAHFDSRAKDSDLWRQEVGVNLMTELGRMVQQLQVERKLVFA